MDHQKQRLDERARAAMPGGVNSPVRAWNAVGGSPVYISRGTGCLLETVDHRTLIDFCCSWGPLILGHAHPEIVKSVADAAANGLSFGLTTMAEVELAELLVRAVPGIDKARLVNSGTEATMTALRLARGYTNRSKFIKFDGCYHGHSDQLLVAAGSGLLTGGISSSAGVTQAVSAETIVAPYNDIESVRSIFAGHDDIAGIIVEPVAGNMGLIVPKPGFLEGLREVTRKHGALLIFDEVISGFRFQFGSYGSLAEVVPDLTCMGKIVGGGMPLGVIGGPSQIMDNLSPIGNVYQAGTLSGNPVAVAAGLATLRILERTAPYDRLAEYAAAIATTVNESNMAKASRIQCQRFGGVFTIFFTGSPVENLVDAKGCDTDLYAKFFQHMLSKNIYLPPSQFEVCFVSAAHTEKDIEAFIDAVKEFDDLICS